MKVVTTVQGVPVAVQEKYMGPARDPIERVAQIFDHFYNWGELRSPAAEVISIVKEAAAQTAAIHQERHVQAEAALAAYQNQFFLVRWFAKKPKAYPVYTEEQIMDEYRQKFQRFLEWLRDKNANSNFYFQQMGEEIAACEAILAAWPTK